MKITANYSKPDENSHFNIVSENLLISPVEVIFQSLDGIGVHKFNPVIVSINHSHFYYLSTDDIWSYIHKPNVIEFMYSNHVRFVITNLT